MKPHPLKRRKRSWILSSHEPVRLLEGHVYVTVNVKSDRADVSKATCEVRLGWLLDASNHTLDATVMFTYMCDSCLQAVPTSPLPDCG